MRVYLELEQHPTYSCTADADLGIGMHWCQAKMSKKDYRSWIKTWRAYMKWQNKLEKLYHDSVKGDHGIVMPDHEDVT